MTDSDLRRSVSRHRRRRVAVLVAACSSGGGPPSDRPSAAAAASPAGRLVRPAAVTQGGTLNIDFATYNPLSLVIKDQGWLEAELADQGVTVNWVKSAGSNKANEALRADAIDVGSTAGSAALLARSNGSPIQVIDIFSQPEWAAIVVPEGSPITSVADLKGKTDRRDQGHRPVLLPAPVAGGGRARPDRRDRRGPPARRRLGRPPERLGRRVGRARPDHGRRRAGRRDAAVPQRRRSTATASSTPPSRSSTSKPDLAQAVVDAYEHARAWAQAHPEETAAILAEEAGLDLAVATKVITERSNLDVDPVPGAAQVAVLEKIGPIFVESGDVSSPGRRSTRRWRR